MFTYYCYIIIIASHLLGAKINQ